MNFRNLIGIYQFAIARCIDVIGFDNDITRNADGTYTIFIEESLSRCEQQNALLHALRHIMGDDFRKDDIQEIEQHAHRMDSTNELCPALELVKIGIA